MKLRCQSMMQICACIIKPLFSAARNTRVSDLANTAMSLWAERGVFLLRTARRACGARAVRGWEATGSFCVCDVAHERRVVLDEVRRRCEVCDGINAERDENGLERGFDPLRKARAVGESAAPNERGL